MAQRRRLATTEFQAVVLATVSDGDSLYPLTDDLPLALLPVAGRPLLSYQLELLEQSHSFAEVIVVTEKQWEPQLQAWVSEGYKEWSKDPLRVVLAVVPEGSGSADALRHIRAQLTTDFVLLAGDVITDVPFQRMADQHRLQEPAVTALFREAAPREEGVAKKARDLDGIDFVGVDEKGQRLLSLEAAADCDDGMVTVSQSLMRAYPHVTLRTDLVDAHVYIFAHWVCSRRAPTSRRMHPMQAHTHARARARPLTCTARASHARARAGARRARPQGALLVSQV